MTVLKAKVGKDWLPIGQRAWPGPQGPQGATGPPSPSGYPLIPLSPFSVAGWTWTNQGNASIYEKNNSVFVTTPSAAGANFRLLTKPLTGGAITTYILGYIGCPWWWTDYMSGGLAVLESGSTKAVTYGLRTQAVSNTSGTTAFYRGHRLTNPTTISVTWGDSPLIASAPPLMFAKVVFTPTTFQFSRSCDGIGWDDLPVETIGTFLTPDRIGVYIQSVSATARIGFPHWVEA